MATLDDQLFTVESEWGAVWRAILYLRERMEAMVDQLAELRSDEQALLAALDQAQNREQALIGGLQSRVAALQNRAAVSAPDLSSDIAALAQALAAAQALALTTPTPVPISPVTGGPDTNLGASGPPTLATPPPVVQQAPGSTDPAPDPASIPPVSVDAQGQAVAVAPDPAATPTVDPNAPAVDPNAPVTP